MMLSREFFGENFFFPISLGNHYFTNRILSRIAAELVPCSGRSLVLICDRLRVLTYQMRGFAAEQAALKVQKEVGEFYHRLENCGFADHDNAVCVTWQFAAQDIRYYDLLNGVEALVAADRDLQAFIEALTDSIAGRFGLETRPATRRLQSRYMIEETCVSLFTTELAGYPIEFYRRRDVGLVVELYERKAEDLRRLLDKPRLARRFVALEALWSDA